MGRTRESEDRKTKQISSVKLQKNICHEIIVSTNIDHDWLPTLDLWIICGYNVVTGKFESGHWANPWS